MRNTEDLKTSAINADLHLIMRKPEDQKNNCNKCIFTFNYAKPEDKKNNCKSLDLLLIMRNMKTKKQLQQV